MAINYYALSAALGVSIGPRSKVPAGPSSFKLATEEMASLMSKRRPHLLHLHESGGASRQYVSKLRRAFEAVREQYSPDRVVADPRLNKAFLSHCEAFGLEDDAFNLNWTLLNLRKNNQLHGLKSTRSSIPGQWRYAFASELAARSIFYRCDGATVDKIVCCPKLVREFDALASALAPGHTPFQYRWAALNIRKKGSSLSPDWQMDANEVLWSSPIRFSAANKIPSEEGIYSLFEDETALYVANSEDLHLSIESQQRLLDVPLLEADLWHPNPKSLYWRYAALNEVPSGARHGLVNQIVGTIRPVFNIPRAA